MNELDGAERFKRLSIDEQCRYQQNLKYKLSYARKLAFPVCFAPELNRDGKINNATGFMLKLNSGLIFITASHVLEVYEARLAAGEKLHWLVGNLSPFDPASSFRTSH